MTKSDIPAYRDIDWHPDSEAALPTEVTEHPLWKFHQALAGHVANTLFRYTLTTQWALASLKSLIEVDYNRAFVVAAGLAYESDVDNEVFTEHPTNKEFVTLNPEKISEFNEFRRKIDEQRPGSQTSLYDRDKGDALRTSAILFYNLRLGAWEVKYPSFHPHTSYPTQSLPPAERESKKEAAISYFYTNLIGLWERVESLGPESQKKCFTIFFENIDNNFVGCANERIRNSIGKLTEQLLIEENKEISEEQLLESTQELVAALFDSKEDALSTAFNNLLERYEGFKLSDKDWVINEDSASQLAEQLITMLVKEGFIESEEDRKSSVLKAMLPVKLDKKPRLFKRRKLNPETSSSSAKPSHQNSSSPSSS